MSRPSTPSKVLQHCRNQGFTEPFQQGDKWWAFPPGGFMPIPLPVQPWSEEKTIAIAKISLSLACLVTCLLSVFCLRDNSPLLLEQQQIVRSHITGIQVAIVTFLAYLHLISLHHRCSRALKILASSCFILFFPAFTLLAIGGFSDIQPFLLGVVSGTLAALFSTLTRHWVKHS